MALFIATKSGNPPGGRPYHVGTSYDWPMPNNVIDVQADGDELEYILRHFKGIPRHNSKRVQTWFGDHAKFIVEHLWD